MRPGLRPHPGRRPSRLGHRQVPAPLAPQGDGQSSVLAEAFACSPVGLKMHSQRYAGPRLGRAWGLPVSFPSPQMRGMARREGACPDFAGRPEFVFRAGPDRRTLTHMTRASAPSRRATAASFRLHGFGGRTSYSRSRCSEAARCRPGTRLTFATPAGAGPVPPSRRLMKRPSMDGTRMTYGENHPKSIDVKRCEQFFGVLHSGQNVRRVSVPSSSWPGLSGP